MPVIFLPPDKMPRCQYCGQPMGYWTPGQEMYSHPDCWVQATVVPLLAAFQRGLRRGLGLDEHAAVEEAD